MPQISKSVAKQAGQYRDAFVNASPFKHAMIENFFEPAFAERLLAEFPSFDPKLAMNEMGELGGKAVNTKIREISPAYRELYEMIGSKPFLELMSRLTGIPDLLMDPKLYGGGTHDNRHGQELDAHVDFNYDEAAKAAPPPERDRLHEQGVEDRMGRRHRDPFQPVGPGTQPDSRLRSAVQPLRDV